MNKIKLAILEDMGLANNGYSQRAATVVNVRNKTGATLSEVNDEFNDLVLHRHIVLLGKARGDREFYCLPEDKHNILAMMEDLTR